MPLVVEFEECWAVGVVVFEMHVVTLRLPRRVSTFLTHVNFGATFLVGIAVLDPVDFEAVGLKGAALCE